MAQYQRSLEEYNAAYHEALAKAGAAVHNAVTESDDEGDDSGLDTEDDDEDEDAFPEQPQFDEDDGFGAGAGAGAGLGVDVGPSSPRSSGAGDRGEPMVPLTPQGRLDDRIRMLRDRMVAELGRRVFERVYTYLRVRARRVAYP